MSPQIDITYDLRIDASGKDPDIHSPTLRSYHKLLWSKPLPSGAMFILDDKTPGVYLHHKSALGEFSLASDGVIPTYTYWKKLSHIIKQVPEEARINFLYLAYTIGGFMVFPGNRIEMKPTINGERGFNQKIADRLDLTLECIRRHYLGEVSPMSATLKRYKNFFDLFEDFRGYIDFFLLNDLVTDTYSVKFFCRSMILSFDLYLKALKNMFRTGKLLLISLMLETIE